MEKSVIDSDVFVIDGTVEGESDHHGQVGDLSKALWRSHWSLALQISTHLKFSAFNSGSLGAVRRAEAVREKTFSEVAHLQMEKNTIEIFLFGQR